MPIRPGCRPPPRAGCRRDIAAQDVKPRPDRKRILPGEDDWARQQARLENSIARQLLAKAEGTAVPAQLNVEVQASRYRRLTGSGEVQRLLAEARRHNRRARRSWIPPGTAWPQPRWSPIFAVWLIVQGENRESSLENCIAEFEHFWPTFPSCATIARSSSIASICVSRWAIPMRLPIPSCPSIRNCGKCCFARGWTTIAIFCCVTACSTTTTAGRISNGYFEFLSDYMEFCQPVGRGTSSHARAVGEGFRRQERRGA